MTMLKRSVKSPKLAVVPGTRKSTNCKSSVSKTIGCHVADQGYSAKTCDREVRESSVCSKRKSGASRTKCKLPNGIIGSKSKRAKFNGLHCISKSKNEKTGGEPNSSVLSEQYPGSLVCDGRTIETLVANSDVVEALHLGESCDLYSEDCLKHSFVIQPDSFDLCCNSAFDDFVYSSSADCENSCAPDNFPVSHEISTGPNSSPYITSAQNDLQNSGLDSILVQLHDSYTEPAVQIQKKDITNWLSTSGEAPASDNACGNSLGIENDAAIKTGMEMEQFLLSLESDVEQDNMACSQQNIMTCSQQDNAAGSQHDPAHSNESFDTFSCLSESKLCFLDFDLPESDHNFSSIDHRVSDDCLSADIFKKQVAITLQKLPDSVLECLLNQENAEGTVMSAENIQLALNAIDRGIPSEESGSYMTESGHSTPSADQLENADESSVKPLGPTSVVAQDAGHEVDGETEEQGESVSTSDLLPNSAGKKMMLSIRKPGNSPKQTKTIKPSPKCRKRVENKKVGERKKDVHLTSASDGPKHSENVQLDSEDCTFNGVLVTNASPVKPTGSNRAASAEISKSKTEEDCSSAAVSEQVLSSQVSSAPSKIDYQTSIDACKKMVAKVSLVRCDAIINNFSLAAEKKLSKTSPKTIQLPVKRRKVSNCVINTLNSPEGINTASDSTFGDNQDEECTMEQRFQNEDITESQESGNSRNFREKPRGSGVSTCSKKKLIQCKNKIPSHRRSNLPSKKQSGHDGSVEGSAGKESVQSNVTCTESTSTEGLTKKPLKDLTRAEEVHEKTKVSRCKKDSSLSCTEESHSQIDVKEDSLDLPKTARYLMKANMIDSISETIESVIYRYGGNSATDAKELGVGTRDLSEPMPAQSPTDCEASPSPRPTIYQNKNTNCVEKSIISPENECNDSIQCSTMKSRAKSASIKSLEKGNIEIGVKTKNSKITKRASKHEKILLKACRVVLKKADINSFEKARSVICKGNRKDSVSTTIESVVCRNPSEGENEAEKNSEVRDNLSDPIESATISDKVGSPNVLRKSPENSSEENQLMQVDEIIESVVCRFVKDNDTRTKKDDMEVAIPNKVLFKSNHKIAKKRLTVSNQSNSDGGKAGLSATPDHTSSHGTKDTEVGSILVDNQKPNHLLQETATKSVPNKKHLKKSPKSNEKACTDKASKRRNGSKSPHHKSPRREKSKTNVICPSDIGQLLDKQISVSEVATSQDVDDQSGTVHAQESPGKDHRPCRNENTSPECSGNNENLNMLDLKIVDVFSLQSASGSPVSDEKGTETEATTSEEQTKLGPESSGDSHKEDERSGKCVGHVTSPKSKHLSNTQQTKNKKSIQCSGDTDLPLPLKKSKSKCTSDLTGNKSHAGKLDISVPKTCKKKEGKNLRRPSGDNEYHGSKSKKPCRSISPKAVSNQASDRASSNGHFKKDSLCLTNSTVKKKKAVTFSKECSDSSGSRRLTGTFSDPMRKSVDAFQDSCLTTEEDGSSEIWPDHQESVSDEQDGSKSSSNVDECSEVSGAVSATDLADVCDSQENESGTETRSKEAPGASLTQQSSQSANHEPEPHHDPDEIQIECPKEDYEELNLGDSSPGTDEDMPEKENAAKDDDDNQAVGHAAVCDPRLQSNHGIPRRDLGSSGITQLSPKSMHNDRALVRNAEDGNECFKDGLNHSEDEDSDPDVSFKRARIAKSKSSEPEKRNSDQSERNVVEDSSNNNNQRGYCKRFLQTGSCRPGCKYRHEYPPGSEGPRENNRTVQAFLSERELLEKIKTCCADGQLQQAIKDAGSLARGEPTAMKKEIFCTLFRHVFESDPQHCNEVYKLAKELGIFTSDLCEKVLKMTDQCSFTKDIYDMVKNMFLVYAEQNYFTRNAVSMFCDIARNAKDWLFLTDVIGHAVKSGFPITIAYVQESLRQCLSFSTPPPFSMSLANALCHLQISEFKKVQQHLIKKFISFLEQDAQFEKVVNHLKERIERYRHEPPNGLHRSFSLSATTSNKAVKVDLVHEITSAIKEDKMHVASSIFAQAVELGNQAVLHALLKAFCSDMSKVIPRYKNLVISACGETHDVSLLPVNQFLMLSNLGVTLMLNAHHKKEFKVAYELLKSLHYSNMNYVTFQSPILEDSFSRVTNVLQGLNFKHPSAIALIAVDICLKIERPLEALKLFKNFSWMKPEKLNNNNSARTKLLLECADLLRQLSNALRKLGRFKEGVEVLTALLKSLQDDLDITEIPETFKSEVNDDYNGYLAEMFNNSHLEAAEALYRNFVGISSGKRQRHPLLDVKHTVLRALVITLCEMGDFKKAKEYLESFIIIGVYLINVPPINKFPRCLRLATYLSSHEVRLVLESFFEKFFLMLTNRSPEANCEQWYSLRIQLLESHVEEKRPHVNVVHDIPTSLQEANIRVKSVLTAMSLKYEESQNCDMVTISHESLYQKFYQWESQKYNDISIVQNPSGKLSLDSSFRVKPLPECSNFRWEPSKTVQAFGGSAQGKQPTQDRSPPSSRSPRKPHCSRPCISPQMESPRAVNASDHTNSTESSSEGEIGKTKSPIRNTTVGTSSPTSRHQVPICISGEALMNKTPMEVHTESAGMHTSPSRAPIGSLLISRKRAMSSSQESVESPSAKKKSQNSPARKLSNSEKSVSKFPTSQAAGKKLKRKNLEKSFRLDSISLKDLKLSISVPSSSKNRSVTVSTSKESGVLSNSAQKETCIAARGSGNSSSSSSSADQCATAGAAQHSKPSSDSPNFSLVRERAVSNLRKSTPKSALSSQFPESSDGGNIFGKFFPIRQDSPNLIGKDDNTPSSVKTNSSVKKSGSVDKTLDSSHIHAGCENSETRSHTPVTSSSSSTGSTDTGSHCMMNPSAETSAADKSSNVLVAPPTVRKIRLNRSRNFSMGSPLKLSQRAQIQKFIIPKKQKSVSELAKNVQDVAVTAGRSHHSGQIDSCVSIPQSDNAKAKVSRYLHTQILIRKKGLLEDKEIPTLAEELTAEFMNTQRIPPDGALNNTAMKELINFAKSRI